MTSKLQLLSNAMSEFRAADHPGHTLGPNETRRWMHDSKILNGTVNASTGRLKGFTFEGLQYIHQLAQEFRESDPDFRRGTQLADVSKAVAGIITSDYEPGGTASAQMLCDVEMRFKKWFEDTAKTRTQFVPCCLMQLPANAFSVGPVEFFHASELEKRLPGGAAVAVEMTAIETAMAAGGATWIAQVSVPRSTPARSLERAEIAVELALAVVKLIVPTNLSSIMSRLTGRRQPTFRGSLAIRDSHVEAGLFNDSRPLQIAPRQMNEAIPKEELVRNAAGACIHQYLCGGGILPAIMEGWCDAAYWYQEGLAEPLDTIATAKLESAIEVLLRAESTPGSEQRMILAIELVTGRKAHEPLIDGSIITSKSFAKRLVAARSRILHGTLSTLGEEFGVERKELESLAEKLLRSFAFLIFEYAKEPTAKDSMDELVNWCRQKIAAAAAQTASTATPQAAAASGAS